MWNLPGPGLEPVSPALAGGFLTTEPPGKSPISISIFLLFQECYIYEIIQYVTLQAWLFFVLRIMPLISIQLLCVSIICCFFAEYYCTVWMYHNLFNHSPTEEHLGCFSFRAITNKADMNTHVQVLHGHSFNFSVINAKEYDC